MPDPSYSTFRIFEQFQELTCAFSTRKGGFSTGLFSSQNLGNIHNDDPKIVQRNRLNFFDKLNIDPANIILPGQTHSTNIKIVRSPGEAINTDALISNSPNLFLNLNINFVLEF